MSETLTWTELRLIRDALLEASIKAWQVNDLDLLDQIQKLDGKVARMVKMKHLQTEGKDA